MSNKPKIGIIGLGMVGTPLKRWFKERQGYERGKNLFLYDIDPKKGYDDEINSAEIIFISVPTPRTPDGSAGLAALSAAFEMLEGEKIVIIKSTVPPGTAENFQKNYPHHKVFFNPEFLTEKSAWEDFIKPDRQIVGFTSRSIDAAHLVLSLLPRAPFMSPWGINTYHPIKITATEAEFIKYAGNVYFSRKIAFANALAKACGKMSDYLSKEEISAEVDYENVRKGMSADYRIGDSHLDVNHGGYRGFGGFCFPKDLAAFMVHLEKMGLADCAGLLKGDWDFNERLLAEQGLTIEDVSVHDAEWVKKKLENKKT